MPLSVPYDQRGGRGGRGNDDACEGRPFLPNAVRKERPPAGLRQIDRKDECGSEPGIGGPFDGWTLMTENQRPLEPGIVTDFADRLNYAGYLCLPELLAQQRPLSSP